MFTALSTDQLRNRLLVADRVERIRWLRHNGLSDRQIVAEMFRDQSLVQITLVMLQGREDNDA